MNATLLKFYRIYKRFFDLEQLLTTSCVNRIEGVAM